MITNDEIKHLAALSRISVPQKDISQLAQEFESILAYVKQLESLDLPEDSIQQIPILHNVFREDINPTPSCINTEKIIAAFPETKGNALSVKQTITHE